jgi:hypothetical protein
LPFLPDGAFRNILHAFTSISFVRAVKDTPNPRRSFGSETKLHSESESQVVGHTAVKLTFAIDVFLNIKPKVVDQMYPGLHTGSEYWQRPIFTIESGEVKGQTIENRVAR